MEPITKENRKLLLQELAALYGHKNTHEMSNFPVDVLETEAFILNMLKSNASDLSKHLMISMELGKKTMCPPDATEKFLNRILVIGGTNVYKHSSTSSPSVDNINKSAKMLNDLATVMGSSIIENVTPAEVKREALFLNTFLSKPHAERNKEVMQEIFNVAKCDAIEASLLGVSIIKCLNKGEVPFASLENNTPSHSPQTIKTPQFGIHHPKPILNNESNLHGPRGSNISGAQRENVSGSKSGWWIELLAVIVIGGIIFAITSNKKNHPQTPPQQSTRSSLEERQNIPPPVDREITYTDILEVQGYLKNLGYYRGSIDGDCGPQTIKAIKEFQKNNGLYVDGKITTVFIQRVKVAQQNSHLPLSNNTPPQVDITSLAQQMKQGAERLNKQAPFFIDDVTRLDSAGASNNQMIIYYTLFMDPHYGYEQEINTTMKRALCNDAGTKAYLARGASYHFFFRNKYGKAIVDFILDRHSCGSM